MTRGSFYHFKDVYVLYPTFVCLSFCMLATSSGKYDQIFKKVLLCRNETVLLVLNVLADNNEYV